MAYPAAVKARALALCAEVGAAEASRCLAVDGHQISAATIRTWSSRAGQSREHYQQTKQATAALQASAAERRSRLSDRLLEIAELGAEEAAAAMKGARLPELVGLVTRSIHDHLRLAEKVAAETEEPAAEADEIAELESMIDELVEYRIADRMRAAEQSSPIAKAHALIDELADRQARKRAADEATREAGAGPDAPVAVA